MRLRNVTLALVLFLLIGCQTEGSDSGDTDQGEPDGSDTPSTYKLQGHISGNTSDFVLTLTVNNADKEQLDVSVSNDPAYEFDTSLSTGDRLVLTVQTQPLQEQCVVTDIDSTVPNSNPQFTVACSEVCDGNSMCRTWLNTHNEMRASLNNGSVTDDGTDDNYPIPSPQLQSFTWNAMLAQVAQNYADKCQYGHNSNRQSDYVALGGENIYIGENIAAHWFSQPQGNASHYAGLQMNLWWDEHSDWHYQTYQSNTINGAGHFTQMIWANTIEIGCGMAYCADFQNGFDGYFGVCNYSPGGNYIGQYPYSTD